ncbi:dynein regulatory complex subunit 4-like isoform X2 [Anabas testudineus]|uniref:Dynein regulatory complex subunit 4 n=1 Tax=Anabas testudineus TaxID=64144 RepID=A0A3Q1HC82_ANATE|nr:dynein regulatory complex subunit 4-like isoform X2 [Anabas testudineus]
MPPKNKGTSKSASAKAKAPTLIDGLTKEEMSKEQLEEHIVRLREELDREREERNYFQLERDKIHTFWQITDRQLEEAKAERKNLDKDIEEDEGRHQVEIKVYKQKMKHLLCEHQNTISELTADGLVSSEVVQKEQEQLETKLHNEMKSIMVDMQELDNESLVKELELKHEEEMTKTKNHWEKQLKEIEAKYEKKIKLLPQELDNMRKNEISEREDHWNNHITALMENHNKALSEAHEMINYMQQDMEENDSLKIEIKKLKTEQAMKEKDLVPVLQENKCLADVIIKTKKEIDAIEKKMKNHISKKDMNATLTEKALNDLKWDYEILEQKFSKLQLERDELYRSHAENIENLQHKAEVKSMLLERKLKTLTDSVEKTQAQLCAVLSASNMDQTALSGITDKIKENLDSSNISLKDLQCKKAQISKARKDLLLNYEAKQRALGVPVEELSAKPFEGTLAGQILQQDLGPK